MKKSYLLFGAIMGFWAVNAYAAPVGDPIVTSKKYVDNAVATRQPLIGGMGSDQALTYPETTGGTPGSRTIYESVGSDTDDTNLVTRGGVVRALDAKQDKVTGTSGAVVMYNNNGRITGDSKGVYNANSTYNSQTQNLVEAQHVNAAITNGINAHLTCAQTDPNDPSYCLLYNVNTLSGTYMPHN